MLQVAVICQDITQTCMTLFNDIIDLLLGLLCNRYSEMRLIQISNRISLYKQAGTKSLQQNTLSPKSVYWSHQGRTIWPHKPPRCSPSWNL